MTDYNFIPNPRAALDFNSWMQSYVGQTPSERVDTVPWGPMPEGADHAITFPDGYIWASPAPVSLEDLSQGPLIVGDDRPNIIIPFSVVYGAASGGAATMASVTITPRWYNSAGAYVTATYGGTTGPLDQWNVYSGYAEFPAGASDPRVSVRAYVNCFAADEYENFVAGGYATLACIGSEDYADGDFPGWEWEGTRHGSTSRGETSDATLLINGGASVVFDVNSTLTIESGSGVPAQLMHFSNDGGATWSDWESYGTKKAWTLAGGGPGPREVIVEFDSEGFS